ncbi:MAG TPA: hypothetical protein VMI54_14170 [Polyangiaceae bacterium]|nr:hypothetical protein [Polyangiaceae bacterium]
MRSRAAACFASALAAGGCTQGATSDAGFDALMRVPNAQYVAGPTPAGENGPDVAGLDLLTNTIWPGYEDKPLRGTLGAEATAATLALSGDPGYWIVPAGVADVSAPTLPTFRATAAFSTRLAPGAYTLEVRAVDGTGQFGAPSRTTLTALPLAPSEMPTGALVVTLSWDTEADLDLHVVDPLGNEIYHGDPSSVDPFAPGAADESAGVLDLDSNADCVIDGLQQEDVTWADAPPSGHYLVRVDTASLCGQPTAHWRIGVTLEGSSLGGATGVALDADTRDTHDRGSGLLAFEFDVP